MTYNRSQAKPLLNAEEYRLFSASLSDRIRDLDQPQLRTAITRARTARDKYRDLGTRQNIAVSVRAGARGAASGANERTAAKATILAEAVARFEKRLEALQPSPSRPADEAPGRDNAAEAGQPRSPNRAERRASASGAAATRGAFMSGSAEAQNTRRLNGPTAKSISAHRSAVGRRNQAKRDGR